MAVTLNRIARLAGCSYGTVSNILSRNDTRYSHETRQRVQSVAKQLGYIPHSAARALVTGRSGNIGIVGVNWNDTHLLKAISAAGRIISANNHKLVLDTTMDRSQAGMMLLQRKVDLVIALSFLMERAEPSEEIIGAYDRIVSFNTTIERVSNTRYTVYWSDRAGGEKVADYLMALGHRRVAMLSYEVVTERTIGFIQRCQLAGLSPLLVVSSPATFWQKKCLAECGCDPSKVLFTDSPEGAEQFRAAMAREPDITAVFARNDRMAASVLTTAEGMGIAVPSRLSIMGYSDESENIPCQNRISSVHTPIADGVRIVLNDYFSALSEKREPRREDVLLEVKLALGHTTAPPRDHYKG